MKCINHQIKLDLKQQLYSYSMYPRIISRSSRVEMLVSLKAKIKHGQLVFSCSWPFHATSFVYNVR